MRAHATPHCRNRTVRDTSCSESSTTTSGRRTLMLSPPPSSTNADLDMVVTATQIRIDGLSGFVRFLRSVRRVRAQLADVDGLLFARFSGTRTVTGWRDEEAMRAFRNSGAHLEAMRSLKKIGAAKSATWRTSEAPDWSMARSRLDGVKFRP